MEVDWNIYEGHSEGKERFVLIKGDYLCKLSYLSFISLAHITAIFKMFLKLLINTLNIWIWSICIQKIPGILSQKQHNFYYVTENLKQNKCTKQLIVIHFNVYQLLGWGVFYQLEMVHSAWLVQSIVLFGEIRDLKRFISVDRSGMIVLSFPDLSTRCRFVREYCTHVLSVSDASMITSLNTLFSNLFVWRIIPGVVQL